MRAVISTPDSDVEGLLSGRPCAREAIVMSGRSVEVNIVASAWMGSRYVM